MHFQDRESIIVTISSLTLKAENETWSGSESIREREGALHQSVSKWKPIVYLLCLGARFVEPLPD